MTDAESSHALPAACLRAVAEGASHETAANVWDALGSIASLGGSTLAAFTEGLKPPPQGDFMPYDPSVVAHACGLDPAAAAKGGHVGGQTVKRWMKDAPWATKESKKPTSLKIVTVGRGWAGSTIPSTLASYLRAWMDPLEVQVVRADREHEELAKVSQLPLDGASDGSGAGQRWLNGAEVAETLRDVRGKRSIALAISLEPFFEKLPDKSGESGAKSSSARHTVGVSLTRAAAVSLAHMGFDDDADNALMRTLKLVTSMLMRAIGAKPCRFFSCLMNPWVPTTASLTGAAADAVPGHLCPVCLRKLHLMLDFSPRYRYEQLVGLLERWRESGMKSEALVDELAWFMCRCQILENFFGVPKAPEEPKLTIGTVSAFRGLKKGSGNGGGAMRAREFESAREADSEPWRRQGIASVAAALAQLPLATRAAVPTADGSGGLTAPIGSPRASSPSTQMTSEGPSLNMPERATISSGTGYTKRARPSSPRNFSDSSTVGTVAHRAVTAAADADRSLRHCASTGSRHRQKRPSLPGIEEEDDTDGPFPHKGLSKRASRSFKLTRNSSMRRIDPHDAAEHQPGAGHKASVWERLATPSKGSRAESEDAEGSSTSPARAAIRLRRAQTPLVLKTAMLGVTGMPGGAEQADVMSPASVENDEGGAQMLTPPSQHHSPDRTAAARGVSGMPPLKRSATQPTLLDLSDLSEKRPVVLTPTHRSGQRATVLRAQKALARSMNEWPLQGRNSEEGGSHRSVRSVPPGEALRGQGGAVFGPQSMVEGGSEGRKSRMPPIMRTTSQQILRANNIPASPRMPPVRSSSHLAARG